MAVLCELWVDRAGRGLAPGDAMLIESVAEAIRRMQEIKTDCPDTIFRFLGLSDQRTHEIDDLVRRAAAAGLTLQPIPPDPEDDARHGG